MPEGLPMEKLRNRYFACRHGESQANVEGIIVSDPVVGTVRYGLTETGRRQVRERIAVFPHGDRQTLVISSDFRRAAETAGIIRQALRAAPVRFDTRLRERSFGAWEGACHSRYSNAWETDAIDPAATADGVESTSAVLSRMLAVVDGVENRFEGRVVMLVSHGDPLMLLQTHFQGMDLRLHRRLPYYATGEIRALN
jgi:probable phosphoglycerate mutase